MQANVCRFAKLENNMTVPNGLAARCANSRLCPSPVSLPVPRKRSLLRCHLIQSQKLDKVVHARGKPLVKLPVHLILWPRQTRDFGSGRPIKMPTINFGAGMAIYQL